MKAGEVTFEFGATTAGFDKAVNKTKGKMKGLGRDWSALGGELKSAGMGMSLGLTAPLALVGGLSIKTAAGFEQSMKNVQSVSGATTEEFDALSQKARDMGSSTIFSASEAADAMYYLASAGYDATETATALDGVLMLAGATGSALDATSLSLVATINQFGLEASDAGRVSNVFAAAIAGSQATMDKLTNSMTYAGPVAASLGYSVEETTAALALMYDAGYTGEQAGTALRGAMSKLLNPSGEAASTIEALGLTLDDVSPALHSMAEITETLSEKNAGATETMRIFGDSAGPAMQSVIDKVGDTIQKSGINPLDAMTESITDTTKATDMYEIQTESTTGKMKALKSQLEEAGIQIGDVLIPVMLKLVNKVLMPMISWFSKLDDRSKTIIITFAGIVAAVGPILLVVGKFLTMLPAIKAAIAFFKSATIVQTLLNMELSLSMLPIIIVILAVIAVVVLLYLYWDEISSALTGLWNGLKETGEKVFDFLKDLFLNFTPIGQIMQHWDDIKAGLEGIWNGIKDTAETIWNGLVDVIKTPINLAIGLINGFIDSINGIAFDLPKVDLGPLGVYGGDHVGMNLANIPYLADGGIVTSPTLAMIGESGAEAVIPLDGTSRGQTITINVHGAMDPDRVADSIVRRARMRGVTL